MKTVLVTGAAGLVGSESVRFFSEKGARVIGIDNDMRKYFFGPEGSTAGVLSELVASFPRFRCEPIDIRNSDAVFALFRRHQSEIGMVVHAAAQPSHDWAAREPFTDFSVNATGTLTLLEATRQFCPEAVFIFTSTNKIYGDTPNTLPFVEQETRWEIEPSHRYYPDGIDETMPIDQTRHSLFGASKAAADLLVQEYGRYFGMKTGVFRAGCLAGPRHAGVELHGFLAYLMKCACVKNTYRVFGYKGKQVRDNLHSRDLVHAFYHFSLDPHPGEVYNIGGGRFSNCSLLEAVGLAEQISGNRMHIEYVETNRIGDHIWWVSDAGKFTRHYPAWKVTRNVRAILEEIYKHNRPRWASA